MILKKPYAFFIKIFKPIHIFMSILIAYLIYISNNMLSFFNEYIYSSESVVGQNLNEKLVSSYIYVIPIAIIVFSLIFLGIMFQKKKPITFYVITIFTFIAILIINVYIANFLSLMEKAIVSIKIVKLNHDLVLINMFIEVITFILLIIRGLGLNFKKFNFDSDISKLNVSELDREEFELSINVDFEYAKRRRKRNLRKIKYFYKENKFMINLSVLFLVIVISLISIFIYFNLSKENTEGNVYSMSKFNILVNKSLMLNKSFDNKKITDNYLIIVDVSLQSYLKNTSLYLKDFSLEAGEAVFRVEKKYASSLIDIGNTYNQENLTNEYIKYIFAFEIPEKYIESDLFFVYTDEGVKTKIKLSPSKHNSQKKEQTANINQEIKLNENFGEISFKINNYDIRKSFLIKYDYCVNDKECIISKEYIKPTINQNFDKQILRLNVYYKDNSDLNIKTFYDFFDKFGVIEYKKNNEWHVQSGGFEELKSKKVANKNDVYIGINEIIADAESIRLVFDIRDSKYVYMIK